MHARNANILFVCNENHGSVAGLLQGRVDVQKWLAATQQFVIIFHTIFYRGNGEVGLCAFLWRLALLMHGRDVLPPFRMFVIRLLINSPASRAVTGRVKPGKAKASGFPVVYLPGPLINLAFPGAGSVFSYTQNRTLQ